METIESTRAEFWEAMEGLREVKNQKDLDAQKLKIDVAKKRLIEIDPEFRNMIEERKKEAKKNADLAKAKYKAMNAEHKARRVKNGSASSRGNSMMLADADLEEFVEKTRFRVRTYEEAQKEDEVELWCPICRERNNRNKIMNGIPTCFDSSHRQHKLVPRSELKNYNRAYRKKWLIRRKE